MTFEIRKELDFGDIKDMVWSGAIYTINMIDKYLSNLDVEIAYLKYVAEQLKLLNEELEEGGCKK